ncbi:DUF421 domain-containing protein [Kaistella polysaccharea]|uniref:DUF421 domain-containing protein n=1 Tax=Kaistella polysaccharea TaxID=2878534 RepID=UPI001CF28099|nr:YetF domain-containing protein [Kaistella polysaccharea]
MNKIFFDTWEGLVSVAVTTILAYIILIFILRISGKRTLAKMNAFDFVVTIALGSILASVILNKSVPLVEGLLAAALLIGLQFCITYISVRSKKFKQKISSTPTLLYYKDEMLYDALKKERIAIGEINKSVREAGHADFEKINAIILEATGDITIISEEIKKEHEAMDDVEFINRR